MSDFQMTPEVICSEYRQAANKLKQIQVLSELNLCPPREIAEILSANGEELPKEWANMPENPKRAYKKSQSAKPAKKAEPESALEAPAAETGITVGKLRELLADLPDSTPVKLDGANALTHVAFTREYHAGTGETRDSLLLSPLPY